MVLAYAARGSTGFGAAAAMPLLGLVIPLKLLIPAWTVVGAAAGLALFGSDRKRVACFEADIGGEAQVSPSLTDDVRQSLLDDLRQAQRNAA